MTNVGGVADAMVMRELPKSQLEEFTRHLKSSVPTAETDLAGVAALLEFAIADNVAQGVPPPFALVEVAEIMGLGPLHPRVETTADILSWILAGVPGGDDPKAAKDAQRPVSDLVFNSWFEAGEAVENLLHPIRGHARRVARLMNDYLPGRREYWARQCAMSALALRGVAAAPHPDAARLALVGRALAQGAPYDQSPLMKQIAERSVLAFESRA